MQLLHCFNPDDASRVDLDLRALLMCPEGKTGTIARRLAGLGTQVDVIDQTDGAGLIAGPNGYSVLVLNCDTQDIGGLAGGHRMLQALAERLGGIPRILISQDCTRQHFPEDPFAPIELRAPASSLALRVGLEHALRDRLAKLAA